MEQNWAGGPKLLRTFPAIQCNFPVLVELPHRGCCYEEHYNRYINIVIT